MSVFDEISVLPFTQNILAEHFRGREGWAIIHNFCIISEVFYTEKLAQLKWSFITSLTNLHLSLSQWIKFLPRSCNHILQKSWTWLTQLINTEGSQSVVNFIDPAKSFVGEEVKEENLTAIFYPVI